MGKERLSTTYAKHRIAGRGEDSYDTEDMYAADLIDAREEMKRVREAMLKIAIECNCRAEHGAEGAAHLLTIERMIRNAVDEAGA